MTGVRCTTERFLGNKTIFSNEKYSSVFFFNYGTGNVHILDNITIAPGEGFTWENQPLNGEIIYIADDIPVSFDGNPVNQGDELVLNLLVMKTFYQIP